MIIASVIALAIGFIALSAPPAFAWGPVTHIALGVQVLASVSTLEQPLQAILLSMPDAFLYGSLAPDIVQGRRFQSRLRRHSHNWSTGFGLLSAARGSEEQAFALGYLAHLGADVLDRTFQFRDPQPHPERGAVRFHAGRVASRDPGEADGHRLQRA